MSARSGSVIEFEDNAGSGSHLSGSFAKFAYLHKLHKRVDRAV